MSKPTQHRSPIGISAMRGSNIPEHLRSGWKALEDCRLKLVIEYGEANDILEKAQKKAKAAREAETKAGHKTAALQAKLEKVQEAQAVMDPLEKQALERRRANETEARR